MTATPQDARPCPTGDGPVDDSAFLRAHADRLRDALALAGLPPGWAADAKAWRTPHDTSATPGWITFHHAHAPATVLDHAARACALDLGLTGRAIQQICSGSATITS